MNPHANDYLQFFTRKLTWLIRLLVAMFLSGWVIASFLSHWSLLDGAPRNSLRLYLDNQAHRPFAYRVLAPALVRSVDASLPATAKDFLVDQVASKFRVRYVDPLTAEYEVVMPGITKRAKADWERADYRRSYVLMVVLMYSSFLGAMLLLRRAARTLGAGNARADAATLIYAAIVPTMFLNGGYFYDFTEQLGATALITCVLEFRWALALVTLLLMQANKETALLIVLFLAPYAWCSTRWRMVPGTICAVLICLAMVFWARWAFSHLPGQAVEWHLTENLLFWSQASSWTRTEDFYSLDIALPRMSYLYFAAAAILWNWKKGLTATGVGATCAFFVLAGLLLTMGFQDEFRNLSLATPFLVLLMGERAAKGPNKAAVG